LSGLNDVVADRTDAQRLARMLPRSSTRLVATDHRFLNNFAETWSSIEAFLDLPPAPAIDLRYESAPVDALRSASEVVDEAVTVLRRAYQPRSYPASTHYARILDEPSVLVWARDLSAEDRPMVAAAYVRMDGKLGACGLLPRYRGHGVGLRLARLSQKLVYPQFVEVDLAGEVALRMMIGVGFRPVYRADRVKAILASAGHHGVEVQGCDALGAYYYRDRRISTEARPMRLLTLGMYDRQHG
jgi:hypothetical protein